MTGLRDRSGKPLNAEAWGEDHQEAVQKWSKLSTTSKDTKAIAAAFAESMRTSEGYQAAQRAEKAPKDKDKPKGEPTILGRFFGQ